MKKPIKTLIIGIATQVHWREQMEKILLLYFRNLKVFCLHMHRHFYHQLVHKLSDNMIN